MKRGGTALIGPVVRIPPSREIPCVIPYMWALKRDDTNELTKQKETHKGQTYGCWLGRIGRRDS